MNGPSLPNPFDAPPGASIHTHADRRSSDDELDTAIDDALRAQPLAAPPPMLYAAVMRQVRREPRPRFRLSWLDVALPLFAAGMTYLLAWAGRSLPSWIAVDPRLAYLRLLAEYQLQKLVYIDFPLVLWVSVAGLMLLAALAAVIVAAPPRRTG